MLFHEADGIHQLTQSLQSVIFALNGNDDRIRARERVDGQKSQRGRTVYQYVIVPRTDLFESVLQYAFAVLFIDQFDFGAREIDVGRQKVEIFHFRGHDVFQCLFVVDEDAVNGLFERTFGKAQPGGGVALRVHVHEEHFFALCGDIRRHVHASRRLTHAPLLI